MSVLALLVGVPACHDSGDGALSTSRAAFSAELRLLDATGGTEVVFAEGEPISFELRVTNLTAEARTVRLPTAQLFDFAVRVPTGADVWRWSHDRAFATVVTPLHFAPRETREFTVVWAQTDDAGKAVGPGTYDASGHVPSSEPGVAAPAIPFRID